MNKITLLLGAAALTALTPVRASFHLFDIQEVYSNADGSVQFAELFTTFSSQQFLGGHSFTFDISGVPQNTLNLSNLGSDSANKTVLIGTANLGTLYGVTPDFTIPANFFSQGSTKTLNFASGTDVVNLGSLPLDGTQSLNGVVANSTSTVTTINSQATPTNYAGQTAILPEPSAALLSALALAGLLARRRR